MDVALYMLEEATLLPVVIPEAGMLPMQQYTSQTESNTTSNTLLYCSFLGPAGAIDGCLV